MKTILPVEGQLIIEAGDFVMYPENLLKLADYLENESEHDKFDMGTFARNTAIGYFHVIQSPDDPVYHVCGTVCCAAGSAVLAGIPWGNAKNWNDYTNKNLIDNDSYRDEIDVQLSRDVITLQMVNDPWNWCFSAEWAYIDNTPQGAAKRIRYLVEHGVPPIDGNAQSDGEAPYIFELPQEPV